MKGIINSLNKVAQSVINFSLAKTINNMKGRKFTEFKNIYNVENNLTDLPDGALLVRCPVFKYCSEDNMQKIAELPIGYYL